MEQAACAVCKHGTSLNSGSSLCGPASAYFFFQIYFGTAVDCTRQGTQAFWPMRALSPLWQRSPADDQYISDSLPEDGHTHLSLVHLCNTSLYSRFFKSLVNPAPAPHTTTLARISPGALPHTPQSAWPSSRRPVTQAYPCMDSAACCTRAGTLSEGDGACTA